MRSRFGLLLILTTAAVGCGGPPSDQPSLVAVTGSATLDDAPLVGASVSFSPVDGTRGASGQTDEEGKFILSYAGYGGCPIGTCKVEFSTRREIQDEYGGTVGMEPETIPDRYNTTTELTADVTADGENNFSFELTGKLPE